MNYKLINKIEKHIAYCQEQIMRPEAFLPEGAVTCALWIEERTAFEKVLLDLYKMRDGKEPDTDYNKFNVLELEKYYDKD